MEDTLNDSLQKVPLLGDIPILGKLFQFKSKQRVKTNLLVFLRPTVLRTSLESNTFSIDRYNEIGAQNNDLSIDEEIVIPPLEDLKMNQKQSTSEIKNNSYKSLLTYSYSSKHKLLALEELKSKKNYIFYISPPDANVLNEVSRIYGLFL